MSEQEPKQYILCVGCPEEGNTGRLVTDGKWDLILQYDNGEPLPDDHEPEMLEAFTFYGGVGPAVDEVTNESVTSAGTGGAWYAEDSTEPGAATLLRAIGQRIVLENGVEADIGKFMCARIAACKGSVAQTIAGQPFRTATGHAVQSIVRHF